MKNNLFFLRFAVIPKRPAKIEQRFQHVLVDLRVHRRVEHHGQAEYELAKQHKILAHNVYVVSIA